MEMLQLAMCGLSPIDPRRPTSVGIGDHGEGAGCAAGLA